MKYLAGILIACITVAAGCRQRLLQTEQLPVTEPVDIHNMLLKDIVLANPPRFYLYNTVPNNRA